MSPVIEVSGLSYAYPDGRSALIDVDLVVCRGEKVAVLGPNGAGKTTLALHLNGVLRPATGTVSICGLSLVTENLREVRRRVGLVFQDPDDQLFMPSLAEDVAFGPANFGTSGAALESVITSALSAVGMEHAAERPPHHLSFGERRRGAIASVLAMGPDVLVLDEPTANLDPAARRELFEVVSSLDVTIVCITHDLPFALELCDRAVILNGGRMTAAGRTKELLSDISLMEANRLYLPFGFDPAVLP